MHPEKHVAGQVYLFTMPVRTGSSLTPPLPPIRSRTKIRVTPPDKGNPDCLLLHSVFFEFPSYDATAYCTNDKNSDESTEQCVCAGVMRSQVFRGFGLAMGVTGAGNLQRWGKVVPAVVRAAWDYPEPPKTKPCPSLNALHIEAFDWEPMPTFEEAIMFVHLLERLNA